MKIEEEDEGCALMKKIHKLRLREKVHGWYQNSATVFRLHRQIDDITIPNFLSQVNYLMVCTTQVVYLSAATGQRPRNYLSCSCPCCSLQFGSFPLKNKFKWKKFLPAWDLKSGPLAPQPSTLSNELWQHWYILVENYVFNLRISRTTPQTLDQYWLTLVYLFSELYSLLLSTLVLSRARNILLFVVKCPSFILKRV